MHDAYLVPLSHHLHILMGLRGLEQLQRRVEDDERLLQPSRTALPRQAREARCSCLRHRPVERPDVSIPRGDTSSKAQPVKARQPLQEVDTKELATVMPSGLVSNFPRGSTSSKVQPVTPVSH